MAHDAPALASSQAQIVAPPASGRPAEAKLAAEHALSVLSPNHEALRILVILGHPRGGSLCAALAEANDTEEEPQRDDAHVEGAGCHALFGHLELV